MPFDERLADRVRELLAPVGPIEEKRMFGGLCFLLDGRICIGAWNRGGLLVRVDPDETDALVMGSASVERMVMGGRPSNGWVVVDDGLLGDDAALAEWVDRGVVSAKALG